MADDLIQPAVDHGALIDQLQQDALSLTAAIEAKDATIAEQSATIASLTAQLDSGAVPSPLSEPLSEVDASTLAIVKAAGLGSIFTRMPNGWRLRYVNASGTALDVGGETMDGALAMVGVHVTHDSLGNEHAAKVGPQHLVMEHP